MTPIRRISAVVLAGALGFGLVGLGATSAHADTTWGQKTKATTTHGIIDTTWGQKVDTSLGDTTWGQRTKGLPGWDTTWGQRKHAN